MEQLEQIIGYTFQNKKLLRQALTHSSYANEKKLGKLGCNERLEFLGDAVLELISSDFLYKVLCVNQAWHIAQENSVFRNFCFLVREKT